jgi:hypothetical protein
LKAFKRYPHPFNLTAGSSRLVVAFLGMTVLLTVLGGFYLSIKTAATIPERLIALGSAAVGALVLFQDITGIKALEEKLRQADR